MNRKSARKGKKGRSKNSGPSPSAQAVSYSGPISIPAAVRGEDLYTQLCQEYVDLTWSGAATTLFQQFTSFGTSTTYTDSYANYREYRCLGMEVEWFPNYDAVQTDVTATPKSGGIVASSIEKTPNGSAFVGTNLGIMLHNMSLSVAKLSQRMKRTVRMNGTEEASWGDTTVAAVSQFSIGFIIDTRGTYTPANKVAGGCFVKRLFQWRNRFNG